MSPPGSLARKSIAPLPEDGEEPRRARRRRSRRLVIVQCDVCKASGSGRVSGGRLVSADLPATYVGPMRHRDCGGLLAAYDIAAPGGGG